ncbi:uncharacterized protein LOC113391496 isoform X2 [Vanessa tameamea]|uniref:Regulatory protein zeste n=1 Tax=Vanessa tameamea TaxID=334116 RepID=A0A8B8HEM5_VANTA
MAHSTKAAPMTRDQTMILVQLVAASKIINCKATNTTNNKLKEQAWQDLTNEYNSSVTSFPRTPSQLRLKWENLKKSARKRCATMKSSCNNTGGGKDYFPPDEILDKVASLLGNTCQGFSVEFGGDATNTNNLNLSLVEEDERLLPLNRYANNDGDGVYGGGVAQEEVLKETQILETFPPKNKNFFLNRASRSGSMGNWWLHY